MVSIHRCLRASKQLQDQLPPGLKINDGHITGAKSCWISIHPPWAGLGNAYFGAIDFDDKGYIYGDFPVPESLHDDVENNFEKCVYDRGHDGEYEWHPWEEYQHFNFGAQSKDAINCLLERFFKES